MVRFVIRVRVTSMVREKVCMRITVRVNVRVRSRFWDGFKLELGLGLD